jgi:hypothetical protein
MRLLSVLFSWTTLPERRIRIWAGALEPLDTDRQVDVAGRGDINDRPLEPTGPQTCCGGWTTWAFTVVAPRMLPPVIVEGRSRFPSGETTPHHHRDRAGDDVEQVEVGAQGGT